MPNTQLTADRRDEVSQVGAMPDVGQERSILLVDRGPVGALHAGVIKEFALDAPGLAKNLGPLGLRLHLHLQRRNVQRARSEEHTSELQSHSDLVCRLLLEKKK